MSSNDILYGSDGSGSNVEGNEEFGEPQRKFNNNSRNPINYTPGNSTYDDNCHDGHDGTKIGSKHNEDQESSEQDSPKRNECGNAVMKTLNIQPNATRRTELQAS